MFEAIREILKSYGIHILIILLLIIILALQSKTVSILNAVTAPEGFKSTAVVVEPYTSTYTLTDRWVGSQFLDGNSCNGVSTKWNFKGGKDPTSGTVNYVCDNSDGLVTVNSSGQLRIDVGSSPLTSTTSSTTTGYRKAVRLTTRDPPICSGVTTYCSSSLKGSATNNYNGGVFVIDAEHIPAGNSVWPAFWLVGCKWPAYGEIDIIEMVNSYSGAGTSYSYNQVNIHTTSGCTQPYQSTTKIKSTSSSSNTSTGNSSGTFDCYEDDCGIKIKDSTSFGYGFNQNGGGVFICEWILDGKINIWFFPRSRVPSYVNKTMTSLDVSQLGTATVTFSACSGYFKDLSLIINTTLCGSWAGASFTDSNYATYSAGDTYNGSTLTSSAAKKLNCALYTADSTNTYSDAYWLLNYVAVLTQTGGYKC